MIAIHTKKMPNGVWSCYTTFKHYDYAFTASNMIDAQFKMAEFLIKENVSAVKWEKEFIHEAKYL